MFKQVVPKMHLLANEAERYNLRRSFSVRSDQSLPHKVSEVAISRGLKVARASAFLTKKMAENFPGYEHLGEGAEQIVFHNNESVVKLLIRSAQFPDFRKTPEKTAKMIQDRSNMCASIFGDIWVPTIFSPTSLPLFRDPQVVAEQPFITAEHSFTCLDDLIANPDVAPETKEELADRVEELYKETGMLPDLIGAGNVQAVSQPCGELALRIVDTIPVVNIPRAKSLWPGRTQTFFDETHQALDQMRQVAMTQRQLL